MLNEPIRLVFAFCTPTVVVDPSTGSSGFVEVRHLPWYYVSRAQGSAPLCLVTVLPSFVVARYDVRWINNATCDIGVQLARFTVGIAIVERAPI